MSRPRGREVIELALSRRKSRTWISVEPPRRVPRTTPLGEAVLCPSYPLGRGVGPIFQVSETGTEWFTDETDPDTSELRGRLRSQVRHAGVCAQGACIHWAGACQLGIGVAVSGTDDLDDPPCRISSRCRWRLENGRQVCGPCQLLTREM